MKKKMLVLIVVLAMIAGVAGCGDYAQKAKYRGPKLELCDYDAIPVTMVSKEQVTLELSQILNAYSEYVEKDGEAELGDRVNICYAGFIGDEQFEGGTDTEGSDLDLGSNSFIDDFEDQLVGYKKGDHVTVVVNFPDPYERNPDLSGSEARFEVDINSVSEHVIPELTDEFVKEKLGADNAVSYMQQLEDDLNEENASITITQYLIENSTFESLPEDEIQEYSDKLFSKVYYEAEYYASIYGVETEVILAYFYGQTTDSLRTYADQYSEMYVQYKYIILKIAELEGYSVTNDEYLAFAEVNYEAEGYETADAFIADNKDLIYERLYADKVMEMLISKAELSPAE